MSRRSYQSRQRRQRQADAIDSAGMIAALACCVGAVLMIPAHAFELLDAGRAAAIFAGLFVTAPCIALVSLVLSAVWERRA